MMGWWRDDHGHGYRRHEDKELGVVRIEGLGTNRSSPSETPFWHRWIIGGMAVICRGGHSSDEFKCQMMDFGTSRTPSYLIAPNPLN